jgi:hypothetical protein
VASIGCGDASQTISDVWHPMAPTVCCRMETFDFDLPEQCCVTIRREHEEAFRALLTTVTAGTKSSYIDMGEVLVSGLSEDQILRLMDGQDDLIYRDDFASVWVLEELWDDAKELVAEIAPTADIQRLVEVELSFADPQTIDRLRTELNGHALLNYTEIEFGED